MTIPLFSSSNIEIVWRVIAGLMATWRRVSLSVIYFSFISFNYVRSIKTRNAFDMVIRSAFAFIVIAILSGH